MKTVCFDLDGVICTQTKGDYHNAVPNKDAISLVNNLYEQKHKIVIYTSRFMGRTNSDVDKTYKEGYDFTLKQLAAWGVKFHMLVMGKPRYDIVIDDKALFYPKEWDKIKDEVWNKIKC